MSEIPEVFAIFEQKLAHVLSFNLRQKGQKKAIEELLVYFSGIVERASKAEARIAELEAEVEELKPYRDGYDPEEVFPPEGEWVWLRDCDDNIEPVQYSHKTDWYWNYEGCWMPDNGDIRRWYPIGKLPEVQE